MSALVVLKLFDYQMKGKRWRILSKTNGRKTTWNTKLRILSTGGNQILHNPALPHNSSFGKYLQVLQAFRASSQKEVFGRMIVLQQSD